MRSQQPSSMPSIVESLQSSGADMSQMRSRRIRTTSHSTKRLSPSESHCACRSYTVAWQCQTLLKLVRVQAADFHPHHHQMEIHQAQDRAVLHLGLPALLSLFKASWMRPSATMPLPKVQRRADQHREERASFSPGIVPPRATTTVLAGLRLSVVADPRWELRKSERLQASLMKILNEIASMLSLQRCAPDIPPVFSSKKRRAQLCATGVMTVVMDQVMSGALSKSAASSRRTAQVDAQQLNSGSL
mmetsp:Transcript_114350/g.214168  ORF Transcript_114350/g.214168 Transcript_114350/m.214168 type:complete len:246 (+) Transcript_114350:212-949(+)